MILIVIGVFGTESEDLFLDLWTGEVDLRYVGGKIEVW